MKTYTAQTKVPEGLYISFKPIDLTHSYGNFPLEGLPKSKYHRIPTLLGILLSPLLGAAFVLAFPAIIFIACIIGIFQVFKCQFKRPY